MKREPIRTAPASPWRWLMVFGLLGVLAVGMVVLGPWPGKTSLSRAKPSRELGEQEPDEDRFVAAELQRDSFAADRDGGKGDARPVVIDGKRTMGYLEDVCKIGPRVSGSAGMKKQQELIEKHFTDLGGKVRYQKFTAKQRSVKKAIDMANVVVSYHPERARRVIFCSHYDTRPLADQEEDERNWEKPFVSANDGASGVALLMELAHHIRDVDTKVGVDFVFFDGEEYVFDRDDLYFFGSKHFAREYGKVKRQTTYTAAILLDMVGGKTARFPVERNSWLKASRLVNEVWGVAAELKAKRFEKEFSRTAVLDDHIALNDGGIPAIDIIDFDYPHWHRLSDVPKNCAPEPMVEVAKVMTVWLQRQK